MTFKLKRRIIGILLLVMLTVQFGLPVNEVLAQAINPHYKLTIFRHNLPNEVPLSTSLAVNLTLQNEGSKPWVGERMSIQHRFIGTDGIGLTDFTATNLPAGTVISPATISFDPIFKTPNDYAASCQIEIRLTYRGQSPENYLAKDVSGCNLAGEPKIIVNPEPDEDSSEPTTGEESDKTEAVLKGKSATQSNSTESNSDDDSFSVTHQLFTTHDSYVSFVTGHQDASPSSKFAGLDGSQWTVPQLEIDRFINTSGSSKWNELKSYANLRTPRITYAETSEDGSSVTIYGVSIPKNHPISTVIWNEVRFNSFNSEWEYHPSKRAAEHVKIAIFKNGWEYLGHVWNDGQKGRWKITLPLGANLQPGDRIFAETQVQGDFQEDSLRWWHDTYEYNVNFDLPSLFQAKVGVPYWGSNGGNRINIPSRNISDPIERAIIQKADSIGDWETDKELINWCGTKALRFSKLGANGDSLIAYNQNDKKAYVIKGGIWWSYHEKGGCSRFGVPLHDEQETGGQPGWFQNFEKGTIYWSATENRSQPGIVEGKIREYYHGLNGTWSELGFPERSEWYPVSSCGIKGAVQNFQFGRVYRSSLGTLHVQFDTGWPTVQGQIGIGGEGGTGWPVDLPTSVGVFHDQWSFEKGFINWNLGQKSFDNAGCGRNEKRPNDPNPDTNAAVQAIRLKEDNYLRDFQRQSEGTGNGKIHKWSCAGGYIWLVDYDWVTLKSGITYQRSVMMYNSSRKKAYLMSGEVLEYYFQNPLGGGIAACEHFGMPIMDYQENVATNITIAVGVDWQAFSNATLVKKDNTYEVQGLKNEVYASNDVHLHDENDGPYIDGYLGVPFDNWRYYENLAFQGQELGSVAAQEFEGGYLVKEPGKNIWRKIVYVPQSKEEQLAELSAMTGNFLEGFKLGLVAGLIPEGTEILGFLFSVATTIFSGAIGAAFMIAKIVVAVVEVVLLIQAIATIVEALMTSGDIESFLVYLSGLIIGGVLTAIFIGGPVGDILDSAKKKISDIEKLSKIANNFSGKVDTKVVSGLATITAKSSNPELANRIANLLQVKPSALKGDISILTDDDLADVVHFLEADIDIDVAIHQASLSKISGDLAQLNKIQLENLLFLVNKTGREVSADVMNNITGSSAIKLMDISEMNRLVDIAEKTEVNATHIMPHLVKLTGELTRLSRQEVLELLENIDAFEKFDSDAFLLHKTNKNIATVVSFNQSQKVANLKLQNPNYELLDTDHTILGDFNADGTFKGGGHDYESMNSYIKNGKVEAYLDENGTRRITDLASAQRNSLSIPQVFVKEYKRSGPIMTKKTFPPDSFTLEDNLDVGLKLIAEGQLVSNPNTYRLDITVGELTYRIQGFYETPVLRTWYFTN